MYWNIVECQNGQATVTFAFALPPLEKVKSISSSSINTWVD